MTHKREKSNDNHAKLQFMNGSNFVKLSKRRTKNVSRGSFLFAVSLFWQIQKCSNFVKLSKRMHIWPHDSRIFHMNFVKIHYRPRKVMNMIKSLKFKLTIQTASFDLDFHCNTSWSGVAVQCVHLQNEYCTQNCSILQPWILHSKLFKFYSTIKDQPKTDIGWKGQSQHEKRNMHFCEFILCINYVRHKVKECTVLLKNRSSDRNTLFF